jgi:hypothetical protein
VSNQAGNNQPALGFRGDNYGASKAAAAAESIAAVRAAATKQSIGAARCLGLVRSKIRAQNVPISN